jgi:hypothetical protein
MICMRVQRIQTPRFLFHSQWFAMASRSQITDKSWHLNLESMILYELYLRITNLSRLATRELRIRQGFHMRIVNCARALYSRITSRLWRCLTFFTASHSRFAQCKTRESLSIDGSVLTIHWYDLAAYTRKWVKASCSPITDCHCSARVNDFTLPDDRLSLLLSSRWTDWTSDECLILVMIDGKNV